MNHSSVTTTTLAILLIQAMAGCGQDAATDTQAFQVRDSAGITIYENSEGEWTEETAWRLSIEPTLTIGVLDGPEEYVLFQAIGARRLGNGNIVIANGGTHELRFYDPSGMHVRSVGREGGGPGEFRSMREPWPLGSDSIAVWDSRNRRLTVFDIDGEFGRSFRLGPIPDVGRPLPLGALADNSLLVSGILRLEGQRPQGIYRDFIVYARYSLEGAHLATFIQRPNSERSRDGFLNVPVPYSRDPTATVFGNRWYYGSGESWEIEVFSPDGVLTHLFRRSEPNRPLEDEDRESWGFESLTQEALDSLPPSFQAELSRMLASMPVQETFPAYRSLIASDDGSLWSENYTRPGEQPSWAVFRDDGRFLGEVETPLGAQVTHIGDDFVLVIWEDELGVQQVQMYELIKP